MSYQSNIVLLLAKSLKDSADLIPLHHADRRELMDAYAEFFSKDKEADDFSFNAKAKRFVDAKKIEVNTFHTIEHYTNDHAPASCAEKLGTTSRLLIVAHGATNNPDVVLQDSGTEDDDTPIDQHTIHVDTLVQWAGAVLGGRKVNRISLHVCYAAGGYPNVLGNPSEFALKFARKSSALCESITARAGKVGMQPKGTRVLTNINKAIRGDRYVNGLYQAENSKFVYTTGAHAKREPVDYKEKQSIAAVLESEIERYNEYLDSFFN